MGRSKTEVDKPVKRRFPQQAQTEIDADPREHSTRSKTIPDPRVRAPIVEEEGPTPVTNELRAIDRTEAIEADPEDFNQTVMGDEAELAAALDHTHMRDDIVEEFAEALDDTHMGEAVDPDLAAAFDDTHLRSDLPEQLAAIVDPAKLRDIREARPERPKLMPEPVKLEHGRISAPPPARPDSPIQHDTAPPRTSTVAVRPDDRPLWIALGVIALIACALALYLLLR